jgi:hypothetical protein
MELTEVARGHVFTTTRSRLEDPKPGQTIVSMLHLAGGVQLRVVGSPDGETSSQPVPPSLEDGYVRLMQTEARHLS